MPQHAPGQWIKALAHQCDYEQLRSYVARGRQHQDESDEQLDALWVDGVRKWAAVIHPRPVALDDAEAELSLRGREPPQDQVGSKLAAIIEGAGRELEAIPADVLHRVMTDTLSKAALPPSH